MSKKSKATVAKKAETKNDDRAVKVELSIAAFRKACDDLISELGAALKKGVDTNAALKRVGAVKEFAGKLQDQVDKKVVRLNTAAEHEAKKAEREAKKAEREKIRGAKKAEKVKRAKDRMRDLKQQLVDAGLTQTEIAELIKK